MNESPAVEAPGPGRETIPLYWWRDEPNFGDAMSPWIAGRILESAVRWSADAGTLVGLGSVLWAAKPGDVVWGSGLHPFSNRWWPSWSPVGVRFLAVRGPLTRDYVLARGGDCPAVYGDPGELLAYFHTPRATARHGVGIIPHIHDAAGRRFAARRTDAALIDPRHPWPEVVERIEACEVIWSSSLHGIIVAEAFGIPAIWTECGEGRLKYWDYYAGSGRADAKPVAWSEAATATPQPTPPRVPLESHPLVRAIRQWQAGGH
ncbi:MAG: polysaccharide pyruvyl transferase family protein [Vicinamibacteria bacterium]